MSEPIRALTVKQPLAWAIVHGHKRVENRTWRFPYPLGTTIAIHSGHKRVDCLPVHLDVPDGIPSGCVLGVVDVVDQHHSTTCANVRGLNPWCTPWSLAGHHHWVLANPRVLDEPVPARGQLWLFAPTDAATAEINRQIGR